MWIAILLALSALANPVQGAEAKSPFTVVLDAGHGGDDSGIRRDLLAEKNLTLEVARQIEAALKDQAGIRVVLTRKEDYALSLDDRKKTGNRNSPGIYVSLHFAGAPSPELRGPRVYVLAAPNVTGSAPLVSVEDAHGTSLKESWKLATLLSKALAPLGSAESAKVAPIPLAPLLGVTIPSALIELDYLTTADASRWADPNTIAEAARMIASGIDRYITRDSPLDRTPLPGNNPPP